jgi:tRNA(Ile2) C34 agmatinyltransferase TiaS
VAMKFRRRLALGAVRKRRPKIVRAATVTVDHIVSCPSCGKPMRVSHQRTFECKLCRRELTQEQALQALDAEVPHAMVEQG